MLSLGAIAVCNCYPRNIENTEGFLVFCSEDGTQTYIHAHYALVTGPRSVKGFVLDDDNILDGATQSKKNHCLYLLHPGVELRLQILRMAIKKNATIFHRMYYSKKEFFDPAWRSQIFYLRDKLGDQLEDFVTDTSFGDVDGARLRNEIIEGSITNESLDRVYRKCISTKNKKWGHAYIIFYLYKAAVIFASVLTSRFFYKVQKKKINKPRRTPVFVVTGPDLAGKSTLLSSLSGRLGWKLPVRSMYGGGLGQGSVVDGGYVSMRRVARVFAKSSVKSGFDTKAGKSSGAFRLVGKCFWALYLGILKRRDYARSLRMSARGEVVIFDRFPLYDSGEWFDGPILDLNKLPRLLSIFATLESRIYAPFTRVKLKVILLLPAEQVLIDRVTVEDERYILREHRRYTRLASGPHFSGLTLNTVSKALESAEAYVFKELAE